MPFFQNLTNGQLKILNHHLHERRYEEDEYLFEINQPGAALYLVSRGEVSVETSSDPKTATQLAIIRGGEFLGELALLDHSPRSASARAIAPTHVYALFRGDLNRLTEIEPEIACEIFKALAWVIGERLKATNRRIAPLKKVIG